jgi:aryl-alcohol dehydrogenase-like predicted oxidoreductase
MIKRKFGWTDINVPIIGQGTWMLEGNNKDTKSRAIETLKLGFDLGMTHIDTAEMYGNGHTEELVAQAITGRRMRFFWLVRSYHLMLPMMVL